MRHEDRGQMLGHQDRRADLLGQRPQEGEQGVQPTGRGAEGDAAELAVAHVAQGDGPLGLVGGGRGVAVDAADAAQAALLKQIAKEIKTAYPDVKLAFQWVP